MSIDWKAAPEGSEKYNTMSGLYYRGNRPNLQVWMFGQWEESTLLPGNEAFIERTKPSKQWSGPEDGLPPVNTSCQMQDDVGQWVDVLIIANHDGYAHGWQPTEQDCFYSNDTSEFRAILTTAQLRESAIRELMDIAQVDCRVTAARLVDAGFKRERV